MAAGEQELRDGICNYVLSIGHDQALEKYRVVSSKPYLIALSLKTIQGILTKGQPMNIDCFNLALRKVAYEDLQRFKRRGRMVSMHYMDLKSCDACQLGKGHKFRTEIDVLQIAKLVFIPCAKRAKFFLIVLDLKSKTVSILDPYPNYYGLDNYKHRLQRISDVLMLVMHVAYPIWNENVFTWNCRIPDYTRSNIDGEASSYYVLFFMCAWDGKGLLSPVCTDAYELRKELLIHLLADKGDEFESCSPEELRRYLRRYVEMKCCKI
ncbi:hypothetical protein U9M48_008838 [Paspalum notatum var. saurae]|uniref:Ubiquitin-like protease family profile domain-containing protein n=1 Tax=Paspalum notatum var. saurae TaxID=547442 RepID=A0AAQ3SQD2_PASNO